MFNTVIAIVGILVSIISMVRAHYDIEIKTRFLKPIGVLGSETSVTSFMDQSGRLLFATGPILYRNSTSGVMTALADLSTLHSTRIVVNHITEDANGTYYIASGTANVVIAVNSTSGELSVYAGALDTSGSGDGALLTARMNNVVDVVYSWKQHLLYVLETGNAAVRVIDPIAGTMTTLITQAGLTTSTSITMSADATTLYCVADRYRVAMIDIASRTMSNLAGTSAIGWLDGVGDLAGFDSIKGIALNVDETSLFVADRYNGLRSVNLSTRKVDTILQTEIVRNLETMINLQQYCNATHCGMIVTEGTTYTAWFVAFEAIGKLSRLRATPSSPFDFTFDINGLVVYTTDGNELYRLHNATAGTLITSAFSRCAGITTDTTTGVMYVADRGVHQILKVSSTDQVSTFAGSTSGFQNGAGTTAQLNSPCGIVFSATNAALYVADSGNSAIRKIMISDATVSLVSAVGMLPALRYLTVSRDGATLYASSEFRVVRVAEATGAITLVAGNLASSNNDGYGAHASFQEPSGVALSRDERHLLVGDAVNNTLRYVTLDSGQVWTMQLTKVVPSALRAYCMGFSCGVLATNWTEAALYYVAIESSIPVTVTTVAPTTTTTVMPTTTTTEVPTTTTEVPSTTTTVAPTTTTTTNVPTTDVPTTIPTSAPSTSNAGVIAGATVGAVAGVVAAALVGVAAIKAKAAAAAAALKAKAAAALASAA